MEADCLLGQEKLIYKKGLTMTKLTEKQAWQKYQDYCFERRGQHPPDSDIRIYYEQEITKCQEQIDNPQTFDTADYLSRLEQLVPFEHIADYFSWVASPYQPGEGKLWDYFGNIQRLKGLADSIELVTFWLIEKSKED